MNLSVFINQLSGLGNYLKLFATDKRDECINLFGESVYDNLSAAVEQSCQQNEWFSVRSIKMAIESIADNMLVENALKQWVERYPQLQNPQASKNVGIIMAGNIPLVGFHDFLCVALSGKQSQIKLSSKDSFLLPVVISILSKINPQISSTVQFVKEPKNIDALIATGSNNSARYFESYYQNIPRIIRKNRSSVAILSGNETDEELQKLTTDILSYFGLGCRNVSKIYVPEGYDFTALAKAFTTQNEIINTPHYANCLKYARALLAMQKDDGINNEYIVLKKSQSFSPPVAVVHYEFYCNLALLMQNLQQQANELQCIVTNLENTENTVPFGKTQYPQLWDYADGVDTMHFLLNM